MMPTVSAIMTPIAIAFGAISVDRINVAIRAIAAVAAISAAGAIIHGTSRVNQAKVSIAHPLSSIFQRGFFNSPPIDQVPNPAFPPAESSIPAEPPTSFNPDNPKHAKSPPIL
jgi:hypothetical protein